MTQQGRSGGVRELTTAGATSPHGVTRLDDSEEWLSSLRSAGVEREAVIRRLHELLLRAARFEAARRRPTLTGVGSKELDDLTVQAADDALVSVLARLDTFRGASRFTTWAYKFAIYETSVKLRRRAWQDREVTLEPEAWAAVPEGGSGPPQEAEHAELLAGVRQGITSALTPHQRGVLIALAVDGVPIDVLADRLGTTRGALYKTLHDARRKLRIHLADKGLVSTQAPTPEETS
ncbi:MAG: sigma-70 family RNA polymerase sigma factor [Actinomycetota bacterium]|nr:sigma-70 family RNA polymerase sigma factor [Actinomycetota bacterium]